MAILFQLPCRHVGGTFHDIFFQIVFKGRRSLAGAINVSFVERNIIFSGIDGEIVNAFCHIQFYDFGLLILAQFIKLTCKMRTINRSIIDLEENLFGKVLIIIGEIDSVISILVDCDRIGDMTVRFQFNIIAVFFSVERKIFFFFLLSDTDSCIRCIKIIGC